MDTNLYAINQQIPTRVQSCMSYYAMREFLTMLLSGSITSFWQGSFFQQNSDYVSSISYIAIDPTPFIESSETSRDVKIGSQTATLSENVKRVTMWKNSVKLFEVTITRYFNNFLDFAPYTKLKLCVPYFGFIDIPMEYAYKGKIEGHVAVDFSSGRGTLYLYQGSILLTTKTAQLSISIPLGKTNAEEQKRNKVLHAIQGAVGVGMIALSGGNPLMAGAGIALAGKTVINAMNDNVDRLASYEGGQGDASMIAINKSIVGIYEMPQNVVLPNAHLVGKPCRQTLSLGNLTGFTKVGDIHFDPQGERIFQDEMDEIVNLLHAGVIL